MGHVDTWALWKLVIVKLNESSEAMLVINVKWLLIHYCSWYLNWHVILFCRTIFKLWRGRWTFLLFVRSLNRANTPGLGMRWMTFCWCLTTPGSTTARRQKFTNTVARSDNSLNHSIDLQHLSTQNFNWMDVFAWLLLKVWRGIPPWPHWVHSDVVVMVFALWIRDYIRDSCIWRWTRCFQSPVDIDLCCLGFNCNGTRRWSMTNLCVHWKLSACRGFWEWSWPSDEVPGLLLWQALRLHASGSLLLWEAIVCYTTWFHLLQLPWQVLY